jgi:anti-anti-sigma regulatory factor
VISLPQKIDRVSGPAPAAQLTAAISGGSPVVVADLTQTTPIDTHGCRPLYQAYREAVGAGARLRLATSQQAVLQVLDLWLRPGATHLPNARGRRHTVRMAT